MEKSVLQVFTSLNNLVKGAEENQRDAEKNLTEARSNLAVAREQVDKLAAMFGFVETHPEPRETDPYFGGRHDPYAGLPVSVKPEG